MSLSERQIHELDAAGWQFGFKLTTEHIWDSFVCLSLLEDRLDQNVRLEVPHGGKQKHRFEEAMHERNEQIVRLGQLEMNHYCDTCTRFFKSTGPDGETIWGVSFFFDFVACCMLIQA
jgi:hypothetical protein